MREFATMGYIKLNMSPDTVVCVPKVDADEEDAGQWRVTGFKFTDNENPSDVMEGRPMLWDFDPRFVKRIALGKTDFDADCSYAVMALLLLATARAEFGNAYLPLYRRFVGQDVDGNHDKTQNDRLAARGVCAHSCRQQVQSLVHFLRSWRPCYFRKPDARLSAAFEEVGRDFAAVVRSDLFKQPGCDGEQSPFDRSRPVFQTLVCYIIKSSEMPTPLFAAALTTQEVEHRDQARRDRSRLLTVRRAQRDRWAARAMRAAKKAADAEVAVA